MAKYLNAPDLLLIALAAYIVIWGIDYFLRLGGMGDLQA